MDLIPHIFFEKQQGLLCAQHALNALFQGPLFTAVDLAAQQLDQAEVSQLSGDDEILKYNNEGSSNYDDTGFFSVQVIDRALSIWDLSLIPLRQSSTAAHHAKSHPEQETAFICNLDQHWFTIRRFGSSSHRWYNLNSTNASPSYVSETYLSLLINQYETEGYSIFFIKGNLNECDADLYAKLTPIPPASSTRVGRNLDTNENNKLDSQKNNGFVGDDDDILVQTIQQSLREFDEHDKSLNQVIKSSLEGSNIVTNDYITPTTVPELTLDEIRRKRLKRFD